MAHEAKPCQREAAVKASKFMQRRVGRVQMQHGSHRGAVCVVNCYCSMPSQGYVLFSYISSSHDMLCYICSRWQCAALVQCWLSCHMRPEYVLLYVPGATYRSTSMSSCHVALLDLLYYKHILFSALGSVYLNCRCFMLPEVYIRECALPCRCCKLLYL